MGRPSKLPALAPEILARIHRGDPRAYILERVGICRRTLDTWLHRGRAGEAGYREFAEEFDRAEARIYAERRMERRGRSWLNRRLRVGDFGRDRLWQRLSIREAPILPVGVVVLLEGCRPFDRPKRRPRDNGISRCPTCHDSPLPEGWYCLRCDNYGGGSAS